MRGRGKSALLRPMPGGELIRALVVTCLCRQDRLPAVQEVEPGGFLFFVGRLCKTGPPYSRAVYQKGRAPSSR